MTILKSRLSPLLAVIAAFSIPGCSDDRYAVYQSSDGDASYVFNLETGAYWPDDPSPSAVSEPVRSSDAEDGLPFELTVFAKDGFYLVYPFNIIIPDYSSIEVGEHKFGNSSCAIVSRPDGNELSFDCKMPDGRASAFSYSQERGVIEFKADCIGKYAQTCTFRLRDSHGLFANGRSPRFYM